MTAGKSKPLSPPSGRVPGGGLRLSGLSSQLPTPTPAPTLNHHRGFCWCLLSPLTTHLFLLGSLVSPLPLPHCSGLFPPSSQLHHRPVISFYTDPYICSPSSGEGWGLRPIICL